MRYSGDSMEIGNIRIDLSTLILYANIILAFVIIFLSRKDPSATWAWVLVLMFIPILGFILYLFLGQDLRRMKVFSLKEGDDLKKLESRYKRLLAEESFDYMHPAVEKDKDLIRLHLQNADAVFTHNNRIQILKNGREKFPALIKALKAARQHIHMEYYIIRNDEIGREVRDILVSKAKEGVEVRLLYDGMGCLYLPKSFIKPILAAGGEAAVFYPPFLPHINVRVNYRNHRKITVIDGKKAFIGGLNLGDEYLGKSKRYGFWRDTHFMIEGSAVDFLQLRFITDWEFAARTHLAFHEKYFPRKEIAGTTGTQIVPSGPDSKWEAIRQGYFKMIVNAEKSIYIQTAYFVPDDSLAEALKTAALGGVDVKIMIPGKRDHPFVHWASTSYLSDLLDSGLKAYIYDYDRFMHVKAVMVDGRIASVGSANFDIRSFHYNFEVNAVIYDPYIVNQLEQQFLEDIGQCTEMTRETYEKRSFDVRFRESVSRLISPLL
jgi:cardiolipin synthase